MAELPRAQQQASCVRFNVPTTIDDISLCLSHTTRSATASPYPELPLSSRLLLRLRLVVGALSLSFSSSAHPSQLGVSLCLSRAPDARPHLPPPISLFLPGFGSGSLPERSPSPSLPLPILFLTSLSHTSDSRCRLPDRLSPSLLLSPGLFLASPSSHASDSRRQLPASPSPVDGCLSLSLLRSLISPITLSHPMSLAPSPAPAPPTPHNRCPVPLSLPHPRRPKPLPVPLSPSPVLSSLSCVSYSSSPLSESIGGQQERKMTAFLQLLLGSVSGAVLVFRSWHLAPLSF